jgi:hypothetical protein
VIYVERCTRRSKSFHISGIVEGRHTSFKLSAGLCCPRAIELVHLAFRGSDYRVGSGPSSGCHFEEPCIPVGHQQNLVLRRLTPSLVVRLYTRSGKRELHGRLPGKAEESVCTTGLTSLGRNQEFCALCQRRRRRYVVRRLLQFCARDAWTFTPHGAAGRTSEF